MEFTFSKIGERLSTHTGILELMDDLGRAMAGGHGRFMLGGGNPAAIPKMQAAWRESLEVILSQTGNFDALLCNYDTPQGRPAFIQALVKFFNQRFDWNLKPENIAITNGSQSAFFIIFNILAGEFSGRQKKKVLLPLMPEYIGYADQGLTDSLFVSCKPSITHLDQHLFKYHVDFEHLEVSDDIGLMAVSRPTNPTGNVLTNDEIAKLSEIAKNRGIPLLIDNAYGAPFPNIIFSNIEPIWDEHIILSLSLSKIGLPGTRTGIVIAPEQIARAVSAVNAVTSLACGNIGQELVTPFLDNGSLSELCQQHVRPFYKQKLEHALSCIEEFFPDDLPYVLHKPEGSLFLWLWLRDLPISAYEFYQRLKQREVIVVPGHYFFYGLEEPWSHSNECVRINYSGPEEIVREGLRIIAEEAKAVWG